MKTTLVAALSAVVLTTVSMNAFASDKVIYGQDNRADLYEVTNPLFKKLADSTVVLVQRSAIQQSSSGVLEVKASSFAETLGVCSTERFADQPSGGFCSGSLIGKNLMLTAGHCITSASSCASTQFVFNYSVDAKGKYPRLVDESNVVGCKEIVYRVQDGSGADFAIIKLDRDVTNHAALKLSARKNKIAKATELVMIGSPAGLPTKVEDGGSVRSNDPSGFFVANTDSYGGNSGSAVFNRKTGEIEGVLVRGEQDYVYKNGCYVSNVVGENEGRGEDVTDASFVSAKMPSVRKH
jgi:V8-like Glu-specific endopeptidase